MKKISILVAIFLLSTSSILFSQGLSNQYQQQQSQTDQRRVNALQKLKSYDAVWKCDLDLFGLNFVGDQIPRSLVAIGYFKIVGGTLNAPIFVEREVAIQINKSSNTASWNYTTDVLGKSTKFEGELNANNRQLFTKDSITNKLEKTICKNFYNEIDQMK